MHETFNVAAESPIPDDMLPADGGSGGGAVRDRANRPAGAGAAQAGPVSYAVMGVFLVAYLGFLTSRRSDTFSPWLVGWLVVRSNSRRSRCASRGQLAGPETGWCRW